MMKIFEKAFHDVAMDLGILDWWELFDSELFDLVEDLLVKTHGEEILRTPEYLDWVHEMAMDL